jgi:hypothetical protein
MPWVQGGVQVNIIEAAKALRFGKCIRQKGRTKLCYKAREMDGAIIMIWRVGKHPPSEHFTDLKLAQLLATNWEIVPEE